MTINSASISFFQRRMCSLSILLSQKSIWGDHTSEPFNCQCESGPASPCLSFKCAINFIQKGFTDDKRKRGNLSQNPWRSHLAPTSVHSSDQSWKQSSGMKPIGVIWSIAQDWRGPTKKRQHSIPRDASLPLCAINAEWNLLDHTQSHQKNLLDFIQSHQKNKKKEKKLLAKLWRCVSWVHFNIHHGNWILKAVGHISFGKRCDIPCSTDAQWRSRETNTMEIWKCYRPFVQPTN